MVVNEKYVAIQRGAIGAALLLGSWIGAQAADFQPNTTVLKDEITYDVNADGTFTMEETLSFRLNTAQAVKDYAQYTTGYSTTLQKLEVLEAYTMTKDGRRIDVAPDKILEQQSPASRGAPMFDDGKVKTVVFPAVEVGGSVTVHFIRTQLKPLFPGQFSMQEAAWDDREYKLERVTVRAPAGLKLYVDTVNMPGGQVAPDKPGTQLWRWSVENLPGHAREIGSVGAIDRSPRVAVSTFPSFEAVGSAYQERAKAASVVTPAIQKLADEQTWGITDRRAQAEALYRWVSTNIRYVGIFLGFGGVVPHEAQQVLEAKYGDCKDHTTLLEALLAAKGIASSPVLVNAGDTYWVPKAATAPGVFNHAITYLPEFKLFVDSTSGLAMFGTLPISERGKSALVVDDGSGKSAIMSLPVSTPENDHVRVVTQLIVDEQGNLSGKSEIGSAGMYDLVSRQVFSSLPPGMEAQVASRVLTLTGQNGTGSFQHGTVHNLSAPFKYTTAFDLPNYMQLPGPGAMAVPAGLGSFSNIASAFDQFTAVKREYPMPFFGRRITETVALRLPDGVKLSAPPKPAKISSLFGIYESSYQVDGQVVNITRTLDLYPSGVLLQPEQYPALRGMGLAVLRDLRGQLVY